MQDIRRYSDEMLTAYKGTEMGGEDLRIYLITEIRPTTVLNWTREQVATWVRIFTCRDIYVSRDRSRASWSAMVDILYRRGHIPVQNYVDIHKKPRNISKDVVIERKPGKEKYGKLCKHVDQSDTAGKEPNTFMGISVGDPDPSDYSHSSTTSSSSDSRRETERNSQMK